MSKQAWVTLMSSQDYLEGVLVLNESLKRVGSQYPLIVALTADLYEDNYEILLRAGALAAKVERLSYSEGTHKDVAEKWSDFLQVLNTASKLSIFSFTDWDKLVYIDADVLILQNMDELFSYRDCSMVKYSYDNMGFTGLFVIEPSHHYSQFYMTLMKNENCFDGDLFGHLWMPFVSYNKEYQIPECYLAAPLALSSESKAIHFCNYPKPWHEDFAFNDINPIITQKYKQLLEYIRRYCI